MVRHLLRDIVRRRAVDRPLAAKEFAEDRVVRLFHTLGLDVPPRHKVLGQLKEPLDGVGLLGQTVHKDIKKKQRRAEGKLLTSSQGPDVP